MAPTIPVGVPASLVAGTTWKWTDSSSDFPTSEGWALAYRISGAETIDVPAIVDGDHYAVTVAIANTDIPAGLYRWRSLASKDGEVYPVGEGTIDVVANPAIDDTVTDTRSFAAKQLAVVELEIAARFNTDSTPLGAAHDNYTIGSRSITKIPIEELQAMRSRLRAEVEMERNGGMLPPYEAVFCIPGFSALDRWRQRGSL